jgi:hypothetical protein
MYKILTLNNIAVAGLERLPRDRYEVASEGRRAERRRRFRLPWCRYDGGSPFRRPHYRA